MGWVRVGEEDAKPDEEYEEKSSGYSILLLRPIVSSISVFTFLWKGPVNVRDNQVQGLGIRRHSGQCSFEGEAGSKLSGEPLSKLIPGIANLGGFRPSGKGKAKKLIVLCTGGKDEEWPNSLDLRTGKFTYYGDNRDPERDLHDTQLGGNRILRDSFELLHVGADQRDRICPFFVFQTHPTPVSARSYQFKGLAVPGYAEVPETADLIAFWKTSKGKDF